MDEQQCLGFNEAMDGRPVFVIGSLVAACCARVARSPRAGESVRATDFIMEAGGKGFNLALAASRLGVPVDGLFAVGEDTLGAFMRDAFAKVGLPPELILTKAGQTGAGVGLIEVGGENRIAVFPGANDRLSAADVAAAGERLRSASIVVAQYEAPDAAIAAAFAMARANGVTTLLNPSPYRRIVPDIMAATDIMLVNESEADAVLSDLGAGAGAEADVTARPYERLARMVGGMGVGTLVVTRGAKGAVAWHRGQRFEAPAFAVEAVDSIGAGDAFTGGLIAALHRKMAMSHALLWGCAAGALAVAQFGLVDALPDMDALSRLLEDQALPV